MMVMLRNRNVLWSFWTWSMRTEVETKSLGDVKPTYIQAFTHRKCDQPSQPMNHSHIKTEPVRSVRKITPSSVHFSRVGFNFVSLISPDVISSDLIYKSAVESDPVRRSASNQTSQRDLPCSDYLQPRQTGSLHSTLSSDEMRWDEMSDMNAPLFSQFTPPDATQLDRLVELSRAVWIGK